MKTVNRFIVAGLCLLLSAGSVLAGVLNYRSNGGPGSPGVIVSDGRTYSVRKIDAVAVEEEFPAEAAALPAVGDMETLLKLLKERGALYDPDLLLYQSLQEVYFVNDNASDLAGAGTSLPPMPMADGAGGADSEDGYSGTNEQVTGVSEGDVVKTDGRYIYILSGEEIRVVRAEGAEMKPVAAIRFPGVYGTEFYLMGDKLALIGHRWEEAAPYEGDLWYAPGKSFTVLLIYDVSDPAQPVLSRRVEMEGGSVSTRVVGDVVYLITNKYVWAPFDRADSDILLPCALDTASGISGPVGLERVYYVPGAADAGYLFVGAVDTAGDAPFEPQAYLGAGSQVYMSLGSLYVTQSRWTESGGDDMVMLVSGSQVTDILRFAVDGTDIGYTGMGTVTGYPISQYSMDEYNGFFRIATTQWGIGTVVTVLDRSMTPVGQTEPLMPNEMMRSMRFMGDMGYVVTFQNTDPLFTVDLSDPYNPKVIGELKIPGFSQYLHPVGGGLLLGVGRDTAEIYNDVKEVVGFRDIGLKVSLFDVSDPFNPKETDVLSLGEGWAEVCDNPRALMCDPSRGLYGFLRDIWKENGSFAALMLRVEDGRLSVAAEIETVGGYGYYVYGGRLLFIGQTLYFANPNGVTAYDYYTFEQTGTLAF